MKWFTRLNRWFRLVLDPSKVYGHEFVEDVPDRPAASVVYLVGDEGYAPWSAVFKCPCNCGETIALSLISNDDPSWRVSVSMAGKVTLSPSIWRVKGCKSHFFIRDGRVLWAREDARNEHRPVNVRAKPNR